MNMELGIRINSSGSRRNDQERAGNSRRQQHQQKLKGLIAALEAGDLIQANVVYRQLLEFSPGLEATNFGRVGDALAQANLSLAMRIIQDIYGQSQAIFKQNTKTSVMTGIAHQSTRENFGVLVDYSA
jgi:hypothetical protein